MTMLEAMAKGAYQENLRLARLRHPNAASDAWFAWEEFFEADRTICIKAMAAALKVLREPTEAMEVAGHDVWNDPVTGMNRRFSTDEIWTAMIDVVLKDAP